MNNEEDIRDSVVLCEIDVNDGNLRVYYGTTSISMQGKELTSGLQKEIALAYKLKTIRINNCVFTGEVPPWLCFLDQLETLDLQHNQLTSIDNFVENMDSFIKYNPGYWKGISIKLSNNNFMLPGRTNRTIVKLQEMGYDITV